MILTERFVITGYGRADGQPVNVTLHADTQEQAEHKALLLALTTGRPVEVTDTALASA